MGSLSRRIDVRASAADSRSVAARIVEGAPKPRQRARGLLQELRAYFLPKVVEQQHVVNAGLERACVLREELTQAQAKFDSALSRVDVKPPINGFGGRWSAIDLDSIKADMDETSRQWELTSNRFEDDMGEIHRLIHVSEQRDGMYASYREQLLELAAEEERKEAAAQAAKVAEQRRRRRMERLRAEELRMARLVLETDVMMGLESVLAECKVLPKVKVDISVKCRTALGETVLLIGDHSSMGAWDMSQAQPMTWSEGHVWKVSLELEPPLDKLQFKAVLRQADGGLVWEKGDNHVAVITGSQDVESYHTFARE